VRKEASKEILEHCEIKSDNFTIALATFGNPNAGIEPVEGLRGKRENPVQETFPPSYKPCIYVPLLPLMKKKAKEEERKRKERMNNRRFSCGEEKEREKETGPRVV